MAGPGNYKHTTETAFHTSGLAIINMPRRIAFHIHWGRPLHNCVAHIDVCLNGPFQVLGEGFVLFATILIR